MDCICKLGRLSSTKCVFLFRSRHPPVNNKTIIGEKTPSFQRAHQLICPFPIRPSVSIILGLFLSFFPILGVIHNYMPSIPPISAPDRQKEPPTPNETKNQSSQKREIKEAREQTYLVNPQILLLAPRRLRGRQLLLHIHQPCLPLDRPAQMTRSRRMRARCSVLWWWRRRCKGAGRHAGGM